MGRHLLATVFAILAVIALCAVRYAPPPAASREAPTERFSATRARDVQEKIVAPDGASRMLGSAANANARKFLLAELAKYGFATETQHSLSCSHHAACAIVDNVIGKLEGSDPSLPAVLISAHYDSVPASPGASDDGMGTAAVMEAARVLGSLSGAEKPKRTIIVLLADGEEDGLLGAEAFVLSHPLAKKVKLAVNVDSRGSTGPSAMFETSPGNAWLVSLMASEVRRPVSTSLFYEVYKRMPNDTDFTAEKRIAHGLNFANTAAIENYHTSTDSLLTTDPRTLQHHGDHALAVARAFASWEGDPGQAAAKGDAVWFDFLATWIVWWPESWAVPLSLLALLMVAGHAWRYRSWDQGVFIGPAALTTALVLPAAFGWGLRALGVTPAPWIASPLPALASLHLAAIAGGLAACTSIARKATPRSLWTGTWLAWSALGVGAAAVAPGTSYVFVVPSLAAGLFGAARNIGIAAAVPPVFATLVIAPLGIAIYDALGLALPVLVAVPTALVVTTLAPFWSGLPRAPARTLLVALVGAVLAALVASITPPFSTSVKQRANVVFRQDDGREQARVFVDTSWGPSRWGDAPLAMKNALTDGGRASRVETPFPWSGPAIAVDAPRIAAQPPDLVVLSTSIESDRRRVRVHVKSRRGAPTIGIRLPVGRKVDVSVCPRAKTGSDCAQAVERYGVVGLKGVPSEGMDVELVAMGGPDPIPIELFDRTHDVPAGSIAAHVVASRPAEATAFQDGDVTVLAKSFAP
jgi:hypothetical protein